MTYLAVKLLPWLLSAFALGVIVGWVSCGRRRHED
jgi:hypothetical protein